MTVAVDVSKRQLAGGEFINDLRRALAAALGDIRATDNELCMDDFGTGQSSLACLHRLPFDVLKIDRSFISGDQSRPGGPRRYAPIVPAITTLGHHVGLAVVAKGVDASGQAAELLASGCE